MTAQARWRAGLQALKPRKSLNKDLLHLFNSPNVSGTGIMTNIFHTIFSIPHLWMFQTLNLQFLLITIWRTFLNVFTYLFHFSTCSFLAALLVGGPRDRLPVVSLGIFSVVPPTQPCALRTTQLLKVSTRNFAWSKGGRCVWLTTYHPCSAETSRKSGALIYPEPLGPPRPAAGDLYFFFTCSFLIGIRGSHLHRVIYQMMYWYNLILLMMSTELLETCREVK